jgi:hypothetical protein
MVVLAKDSMYAGSRKALRSEYVSGNKNSALIGCIMRIKVHPKKEDI